MDLHRLAEQRSIAYHRAIATRARHDPAILERARARVRSWTIGRTQPPYYARAWERILAMPLDDVAAMLEEDSERACELRQSTPFAGALPPRERWRIWREARKELEPRR